jgi:transposase
LFLVRGHNGTHGVARRANALLLLDKGWSFKAVAEALFIDDSTVRDWHSAFVLSGVEELAKFGWRGGSSNLSMQQQRELASFVEHRMCRSTAEIIAWTERKFGVIYGRSGMIKLLSRLGFEYRKPKPLPAIADEAVQAAFIAAYEDLLNNLDVNETVYFVDAVHPEYQSRPAHGWFKRGSKPAVPSTSGRARLNVHGALNLETGHFARVENTTVDAQSTIQLMQKLLATNPGAGTIHVYADNARYHHARVFTDWLGTHGNRIKIHFLPSYCPHLNPIERLWATMHKAVTHNRYYPNANEFCNAILRFFDKTLPDKWLRLRDKISDNFRIISHDGFRMVA